MQATKLQTNHLTSPLGMDGGPLFLSWQCTDGLRQTAYEIRLTADGAPLWESGKVVSRRMHAEAPAVTGSRVRGAWRIRLWDENDQLGPWSEATFETGLTAEDWQGLWVDPETKPVEIPGDDAINAFARPRRERKQAEKEAAGKGAAEPYQPHRPASYLRKTFTAPAGRGRLYITAKGLYVAWLNGKRVGDMVLAPGSFTADKHLGVHTYDVTDLLQDGENELLLALGDGWYRSTSGVDGDRNLFGDRLGVLFQLEVDGKAVCVSDDAMEATQQGPIRQNDLQQGEVYDARLEGALSGWHGVRAYRDALPLTGMNTVAIREQEAFPGRLFTTPNGETVLDFGQNMAGYVEMTLTAHAGQKVLLTCGETLDENGNFTQENFQDRARHKEGGTAQMLELICKEGVNHWKPSFTIMGFQYARVETDVDLTGAVFTAHAVYSDMAVTGSFTCGNEAVNKLVANSIWSQKGNFCDIPTDCPTRERAGWTGDMGVFIETGLTLMDCYPVVAKWLEECRLNQYPDGRMANIAPPNSRPGYMTPMLCMSAGWGDAAILVPYALYQRTGDRRILADNYGMMQRWYAFLLGRAQQTTEEQQGGEYAKYTVLNGLDYGEWCEPGVTPMQAMANPRKSVGTAYLAYSGRLLAEIAAVLGHQEDANRYRDTADKAAKAYRAAFTENGVIHSDRQCEYVRLIAFGLLDEAECRAAADTLNRMVVDNGYHLNTGFLSTPYLCGVLARYGYTDTAYRLLLQPEAPGWLYEVGKGANTVWETWTGIDVQGKPHESLNHYSYERNEQRQGYRSGHYNRNLTTTSGDVTLRVPKLKGISFETAIIERYRRRESSVEEALIEMYLAGVSVRRVEDITEALWGSKVSPSTISDLNKKAYVHIEDWRNRPLQGGRYPYVYVDGIYLRRNWGGEFENVAILVAIAVNEDGYREVLGAAEGMKEDKASWVNFFQWLRGRGLDGVKLVVGDKCLGMLEAVGEVFPEAKYQRCTVHFYRNVFAVTPRSKAKLVAKMLKAIHAQESKKAARDKARAVVEELRSMKLKEAAKKVEDGIEETLTYCDFPSEHWTRIRTNNVIERLNREIRRRTRVVGSFPDGNSALMLVCARLRHVAGTQWGNKKYMNMKHLEAAFEGTSIAG